MLLFVIVVVVVVVVVVAVVVVVVVVVVVLSLFSSCDTSGNSSQLHPEGKLVYIHVYAAIQYIR